MKRALTCGAVPVALLIAGAGSNLLAQESRPTSARATGQTTTYQDAAAEARAELMLWAGATTLPDIDSQIAALLLEFDEATIEQPLSTPWWAPVIIWGGPVIAVGGFVLGVCLILALTVRRIKRAAREQPERAARVVVGCGLAIMALMGLFPPWLEKTRWGDYVAEGPGCYGFVFAPPSGTPYSTGHGWQSVTTIDVKRLAVQEGTVMVGTIALVLLTRSKAGGGTKGAG
jgi:hypothetical protein